MAHKFIKGFICWFLIVLECVLISGITVHNCPDHDLLKHLTPNNEYAFVEWNEPYTLQGSRERTSGHIPPHYFRKGEHEVKYTFSDATSTMECVFRVIIVDAEETDITPPTVQCPHDKIASVTSATQLARVWWEVPLFSDDSGFAEVVNQTIAPGSLFHFGFTPVTITVQDAVNLTASCTFTVKVGLISDKTPPTITNCPNNIIHTAQSGRSDTVSWVPPSARDDVGIHRIKFQSHHPGDTFNEGTTRIKYFFEDSSGNIANCSFTITVLADQLRPAITNCPGQVIRTISPGQIFTLVRWLEPTATDESGDVSLRYASHRPGDEFGVGTENVTYEFADDADNKAFCIFPVIVNAGDTSPPVINDCPNDIMKEVPLGVEFVSISWIQPRAIDNSGTVMYLNSTHAPGSSFSEGTTTVEHWFTDLSENTAVCRFSIKIKIVDISPPVVRNCPSDFSIAVPAIGGPVAWSSPIATDASGESQLLSVTHESGSVFKEGNTTVRYLFADNSHNEVSCSFVVTAYSIDESVVQNCPNDINVTRSESSNVAVTWLDPVVIGNLTQNQTHYPGDIFPLGTTRVEYQWQEISMTCAFLVSVSGSGSKSSQNELIYTIVGSVGGFILIVVGCLLICRRCNHQKDPNQIRQMLPTGQNNANSPAIWATINQASPQSSPPPRRISTRQIDSRSPHNVRLQGDNNNESQSFDTTTNEQFGYEDLLNNSTTMTRESSVESDSGAHASNQPTQVEIDRVPPSPADPYPYAKLKPRIQTGQDNAQTSNGATHIVDDNSVILYMVDDDQPNRNSTIETNPRSNNNEEFQTRDSNSAARPGINIASPSLPYSATASRLSQVPNGNGDTLTSNMNSVALQPHNDSLGPRASSGQDDDNDGDYSAVADDGYQHLQTNDENENMNSTRNDDNRESPFSTSRFGTHLGIDESSTSTSPRTSSQVTDHISGQEMTPDCNSL